MTPYTIWGSRREESVAEYEEKCGSDEGAEVSLLPPTAVFYPGKRFLCIYNRYMELYFEISDFAGFFL